MAKEFTDKNAVRALKDVENIIDRVGEQTGVWEINFHTPGGKWKYTDYIQFTKPDHWIDYDILINRALRDTPAMFRETNIREIGNYWTVVMLNNPFGFPIMVVGSALAP